jgi:membrane-associated phospholipid phosphatase
LDRTSRLGVDHDRSLAALGAAGFLAGAVAARRPAVDRLEERWFTWANAVHARWHAPVWAVMQLGSLGGVAAVSAVAATRDRALARQLATAGTVTWVGAKALKRTVGRGRPSSVLELVRVLGREQTGLGYPSGHAAVAAALASVAAPSLGTRPARRAVWGVALAVGQSRTYVGAHLPLDVVGGTFLGLALGKATRLLERRLGT